jgi:hypothetical protein
MLIPAAHRCCFRTASCMTAQVRVVAAKYGMEGILAFFGPITTCAPPTAVGGPHIGFSAKQPYLSNLIPPGCARGVRIGAAFAGTGGPLTTAAETPAQGSDWANQCLEHLASQACIAHHEHLQVSAGAVGVGGGGCWWKGMCPSATCVSVGVAQSRMLSELTVIRHDHLCGCSLISLLPKEKDITACCCLL